MKWSKSLCRIVALGALISRALSRTIKPIVYSYSSWSNDDKKNTASLIDSNNLYPTFEHQINFKNETKTAEKSPSEPVVANVTAPSDYVFVYNPRSRINHRFKSDDRLKTREKVLRRPNKYVIRGSTSTESPSTEANRVNITSSLRRPRFRLKNRLNISRSRNEIPVNEEGSKEEGTSSANPLREKSYSAKISNFVPPKEPDLRTLTSKLHNLQVESAIAINNAIMPSNNEGCDWCTRGSENSTESMNKSSHSGVRVKKVRTTTPPYYEIEKALPITENLDEVRTTLIGGKYQRQKNISHIQPMPSNNEDCDWCTQDYENSTESVYNPIHSGIKLKKVRTTTPPYYDIETTLPITENVDEVRPTVIGGKYQRQKSVFQIQSTEETNEETEDHPDEETNIEETSEQPSTKTKILQKPLKYYYSNDQKPASSGNSEAQKEEDKNHKKGGGEENKAEFHEKEGGKYDKGYKSNKVYDHGSKGHKKNEDRKKVHKEQKGKKKSQHEEDSHYHEDHNEMKGEKEAEFGEEGKHKKGHSTKGSHNVHKKNEFLKKHEFYDEHHEADDHKKYKDFDTEYKHGKGGKHKKAHNDKNYLNDHKGKKGHKKKGGRIYEDKGYEKEYGGQNKYEHEEDYEEEGDNDKKSKWLYEKD